MGETHTCCIDKIYQLGIMVDQAIVHYHNTLFSRPGIHSRELSNIDSMKKVCELCWMHHLLYDEIVELIIVKWSQDWAYCIIATDANCCHCRILITTHEVVNKVCMLPRRCASVASCSIMIIFSELVNEYQFHTSPTCAISNHIHVLSSHFFVMLPCNLVEQFSSQTCILKVLVECTVWDSNIVVNNKPTDKFIKVCICFVVIGFLDSSQHSMNNDFWPSKQCRGWPADRVEFCKDVAPPVHACLRDTKTFQDEI